MRTDKAKNISKVLTEVIKDPLATERKIAKDTGLGNGTVHRAKGELEQIGAKSDIILEICDLDINLVRNGLKELNRRFNDQEEIKKIRPSEVSSVMKDSTARYSVFKGDITDKDGALKEVEIII